MIVAFTDWIGWPWWVGFGLGSPLVALLISFDDATGADVFGGDWANDDGFGRDLGGAVTAAARSA